MFTRAQESPFALTECHWPTECELTITDSASWSWGISLTPKMGKAYKVGISGGYGESYGTSTGHSWSVLPEPHECGYFTFVPTKKTTCGFLTVSDENWWDGCYHPKTFDNDCAVQVWTVDDKPDGVVIFVKINCVDRTPMPMDQQDLIFALPGVALDRGTLSTMMSSWPCTTCSTWLTHTHKGEQNAFEIRGKNIPEDKLGANGEHLLDGIRNCGDTSGCTLAFMKTPDDPRFEWECGGRLATDVSISCIGDAVVTAGGKFPGWLCYMNGCKGLRIRDGGKPTVYEGRGVCIGYIICSNSQLEQTVGRNTNSPRSHSPARIGRIKEP